MKRPMAVSQIRSKAYTKGVVVVKLQIVTTTIQAQVGDILKRNKL